MIWRLLLRSWARIRDLAPFALLADYFLRDLGGWIALSAGIGIAAILTAAMATAATTASKAANTEQRVNALVGSVGNLSGQNTSSNGLPDGGLNGHSELAGLLDGTINGSTGQINTGGGTAHTHGSGSLAVKNGQHYHTAGTYSVANGVHNHTLPNA